jgi:hypothetical protein
VAVFSFLQEFSSTALAKHFKTDLNLKETSETCWNLLENISRLVAQSRWRAGDDNTTTCARISFKFLRKSCDFFYGEAMIFYGMHFISTEKYHISTEIDNTFYGTASNFYGKTLHFYRKYYISTENACICTENKLYSTEQA